ncbi:MAG: hypothetical protein LRY50_11870 [Geovibrio sp.]|nr:hypothetical protein [Geovibrio sp.]MCD8568980.1 hypothetical protein [Geovibrio sp.]
MKKRITRTERPVIKKPVKTCLRSFEWRSPKTSSFAMAVKTYQPSEGTAEPERR